MNISQEQVDSLNAVITIKVEPQDYQDKVEQAVKKVQKQAALPGFRPGKAPSSLIKKMYGKNVLVDELNKILDESLHQYIVDNKLEILGQPLAKANNQPIELDNNAQFEFIYELGLAPAFQVDLSVLNGVEYPEVTVDEQQVEKFVTEVQRHYGKAAFPEVSENNDLLYVDINELDVDGSVKAGGVFKSTSINLEKTPEGKDYSRFLGLKKGDTVTISCEDLFESAIDKQYRLGIDKEIAESFNSDLKVTVNAISRIEPAELNQELFEKIYQEGVTTIEEFKEKIKTEISNSFVSRQDFYFYKNVKAILLEKYPLQLPESFLKRWIISANEKPVTEEALDKDIPQILENTRVQLYENKLIEMFELKVEQNEVRQEAERFVYEQYMRYGMQPDPKEMGKIVGRILNNRDEVQRIMSNLYAFKVIQSLKEKLSLNKKAYSKEEFELMGQK